jgi:hypothetical protein
MGFNRRVNALGNNGDIKMTEWWRALEKLYLLHQSQFSAFSLAAAQIKRTRNDRKF